MVVKLWRKLSKGHSRGRRARAYRLNVERLEKRELLDGSPLGAAYGQIPLSFEANQGQTDPQVNFLSRGSGYALFLTPSQAVLSLQKQATPSLVQGFENVAAVEDVLRMQLVGGNSAAPVIGLDKQATMSNYLIGNAPSHWRTNVPNYDEVEYQGIYPGINLIYYGNQRQLEYDFVVRAGADPSAIRLSFQGAQDLTLDAQGNLVLRTAGGDVVEHSPVIYQENAGVRQSVSGRYRLLGPDRVGFQVDGYDASRPLVIDPVLSYSTYLGGSGPDYGTGIAVDASGNAYVTGYTVSTNFPTTVGSMQPAYSGGSNHDAFVAKLNSTGTALLYSTYLGGSAEDRGYGITVDGSGDAYVTGFTQSSDFPITPGAFRTTLAGTNAFVAKLNASGTGLLYGTYLGGSTSDVGNAIAADVAGDAYVTGNTLSSDFPTTAGALQRTLAGSNDIFVAKLNTTGTALLYATYLGGTRDDISSGIAVDTSGDAYVTGKTVSTDFPTTAGAVQGTYGGGAEDAFVAKLNATGTALLYSTFLGGNSNDAANGIAVDISGNAYVTGRTSSSNFPTTPGAMQTTYGGGSQDAFVAKLNATGTALVYSTYLGGNGDDSGTGIAVDASGNAYVTGTTYSGNFPTTPGAIQATLPGSNALFVAKLNTTGTALLYATYLGGSVQDTGSGIALDISGNVYVTGSTNSSNFPATTGAFARTYGGSEDALVAKIGFAQATVTTMSSPTNPSVYGQSITFTATITSSGSPLGSGTVTFQEGSTVLAASVPLNSSGQGSFVIATLTAGGSPHTITAIYNGSLGFDNSSGNANHTVNKAPLTVTADNQTKVYGQANPILTAHYSGFVLGENQSVLGGTLSTAATASSPVGNYAISPVGLTSSNYALSFVSGTLTITPAALNISADNQSVVYGSALPTLTASYSGLVNGDTAANLTTPPSLSTTATSTSPVGNYVISVGGPSSPNYTITFAAGNLAVAQDSTVTVLSSSAAASLIGQPITLTATVAPGASGVGTQTGSVTFLDQGTTLATVLLSGGTAVFTTSSLSVGIHSLSVSFSGDSNHLASSSTATAVPVGTATERFVGQLYLLLLLRQADAGGLASWTAALNTGVTRTQVAMAFQQSTEWRTDQVQALYQQLLHRGADPSGINTYVTFLGTGGTLEQLKTILTGSLEYLQVRGGGTTTGFLTALYQDALNRSSDAGGLATYTQALSQGSSRQGIAAAFFGSTEYLQGLVASYYQRFLNRGADAGGLNSFVTSLQAGLPDQVIIAAMLGSGEFFAHV